MDGAGSLEAVLKRLLAYPAYRVAWKMARDSMSGSYREYLDSVVREGKHETSQSLTELWKAYVSEELTTT